MFDPTRRSSDPDHAGPLAAESPVGAALLALVVAAALVLASFPLSALALAAVGLSLAAARWLRDRLTDASVTPSKPIRHSGDSSRHGR